MDTFHLFSLSRCARGAYPPTTHHCFLPAACCTSLARARPRKMRASFALALALAGAAFSSALPTTGSLRALAITNAENDQDQGASVAQVNPTTGAVSLHGNFSFAVTVIGLDCATSFVGGGAAAQAHIPLSRLSPTWREDMGAADLSPHSAAAGSPVYIAVEGDGPNLMTIDATTGKVLSTVLLKEAYAVVTASWDPAALNGSGALVGLAGPPDGKGIDYIAMDIATGDVTPITRGLSGLSFPLPCESAVSVATQRLYVMTDTKETDESDEELLTLDLATGKVLSTIPWPSKNKGVGYANSLFVFPPGVLGPASTTNETVGLWTIDHSFNTPPRLVSLDPVSGHSTVIASVPLRGSLAITIPVGSSALILPGAGGGNATVAAFAFSDAEDEPYMVFVDIAPPQMAEGAEGEGGEAALASARAVKLKADGVQLFWAPAWVQTAA